MPVNYIDFKQAKDQPGLRMVVVPGIPSPWSEAAKGILQVKKIPWSAVRLDQRDNDMAAWTKTRSGPVAMHDNEKPKAGWSEILMLAERLAPEPALLPKDARQRADVLGLCHEICGEQGLGWMRRLEGVHQGLCGTGGFPQPIAQYLGHKYGYHKDQAGSITPRIVALLKLLADVLRQQQESGQRFYVGSQLSAVDIYSATFMAYFKPLPADQCPMQGSMRTVFEAMDEPVAAALDPILIEHRDFIYQEFLELPLSL